MEVPKNLYLDVTNKCGEAVFTVKNNDTYIEYTRTDAFIDKAAEYLSYHLDTSKIDVNYKFEFIEEFRKYMKGE